MFRRLDVKIIILIIVTSAVPIILSIYFANEAIKASLAVGLNKDVATTLNKDAQIYKNHIETIKRCHDITITMAAKSEKLKLACQSANHQEIKKQLSNLIPQKAQASSVNINLKSKSKLRHKIKSSARSKKIKRLNKQREFDWGICESLEIVFDVDNTLVADYKKAALHADTYTALFNAPRSYVSKRIIWVYGSFLSIILVISIWQGIFWTRKMSRRIHTLSQATKAIAQGDVNIRVESGPLDEVGNLILSFNNMIDEIVSTRMKIEYLQKIATWQEIARRLAHEIKNPLTPIRLASQQLREKFEVGDPKFERLLQQSTEIIEEEVATLKRLVADFSSFAKLPEVVLQKNELGSFLKDCQLSLSHMKTSHNADIKWTHPKENIPIALDTMMLKRVVDNIVRNGVESAGSISDIVPELSIWTKTFEQKNRSFVEIYFKDNGPGIADEYRSSIFEPYFTTKDEGTGLGLAISQKIVIEHKGSIKIDPAKDTGTIFTVTLPLSK